MEASKLTSSRKSQLIASLVRCFYFEGKEDDEFEIFDMYLVKTRHIPIVSIQPSINRTIHYRFVCTSALNLCCHNRAHDAAFTHLSIADCQYIRGNFHFA